MMSTEMGGVSMGEAADLEGGAMEKWREDRKSPAWCMEGGKEELSHKALSQEV